MTHDQVSKHFEKIGARIRFREFRPRIRLFRSRRRVRPVTAPDFFSVDIRHDRRGEFFDIVHGREAPDLEVLQVVPKDQHLLLYSRDGQRFLCGHDERHWFVAAVKGRVSTVRAARQSLQPDGVREQAARFAPSVTDNRRNRVFKRQGEWFFVPAGPDFDVSADRVIRNEPIQRNGAGKPHICEELFRTGGRLVYVLGSRTLSQEEFEERRRRKPGFGRYLVPRVADPDVYVRGRVRHADHATITLVGWHRLYINGEVQTASVGYID